MSFWGTPDRGEAGKSRGGNPSREVKDSHAGFAYDLHSDIKIPQKMPDPNAKPLNDPSLKPLLLRKSRDAEVSYLSELGISKLLLLKMIESTHGW
jgi:hypothetical protein